MSTLARFLAVPSFLIAGAAVTTACSDGTTICDAARDHILACGRPAHDRVLVGAPSLGYEQYVGDGTSCASNQACFSMCYLEATCTELPYVFGRNTDPNSVPTVNPAHYRCMLTCAEGILPLPPL